jgi:predicted SAM-dependent methyltransferase
LTYETSNIVGEDVDLNQDLTAMTVERKYDLIICHRVLEHVMDDGAAFRELYRILVPGGLLQISVPQSMQEAMTKEWVIPDETHHEHVRHYGRDFSMRLEAAGFSVAEELWLLRLPRQELLAHGAYPLRMYHARKPL